MITTKNTYDVNYLDVVEVDGELFTVVSRLQTADGQALILMGEAEPRDSKRIDVAAADLAVPMWVVHE